MNNIISYIDEFGDKSFDKMPFNEVDSLILCQMSYLNFRSFVPGIEDYNKSVSIQDILLENRMDDLLEGYWFKNENRKLFTKAAKSVRFGDMKMCFFTEIFNEEHDTQFCAITFILGDKSIYFAFRGTDSTLIGWKEDLKLAYSEPIRSQKLAAEYVDTASTHFAGKFRMGGHSKGGNLAVYAAMFCKKDTRRRILEVFDHDGPGFRPEILREGHFEILKGKIHKYIPKSSIVGILLESTMEYEVIESRSIGAMQHNTYFWKSKDGKFIRSKGMTRIKKTTDAALNEWIYSLSDDEVSTFVDALFDVLTASDAKTLFELAKNPQKSVLSFFSAYKEMDKSTKEAIFSIIRKLVEGMSEKTFEEFLGKKEPLGDIAEDPKQESWEEA